MSNIQSNFLGRIYHWLNQEHNKAPYENQENPEDQNRQSNNSSAPSNVSNNSSRQSSRSFISNLFRSPSNQSDRRSSTTSLTPNDSVSQIGNNVIEDRPTNVTQSNDSISNFILNMKFDDVSVHPDQSIPDNAANSNIGQSTLLSSGQKVPKDEQAYVDELIKALKNSREGNYGIDTISKDLIPKGLDFASRESNGNNFRGLSIGLTLESMLKLDNDINIQANKSKNHDTSIAEHRTDIENIVSTDRNLSAYPSQQQETPSTFPSTNVAPGSLQIHLENFHTCLEELKPVAIQIINESLTYATPEVKANSLEILLDSLHPIETTNNNITKHTKIENQLLREKITTQMSILAIVNEHTKFMAITPDGKLNVHDERVLTKLAAVMHNLHAAHLGDSIKNAKFYFKPIDDFKRKKFHPALRNPQMAAAKILKRRQEALLLSSPKAAVELAKNIADNCKISELSTDLRALSDKHVIKTTTSVAATAGLYALSSLVIAPAIQHAFHGSAQASNELQAVQDQATQLTDQLNTQNQNIAQLAADGHQSLNNIVPGSETCEATWSALHPDGVHTQNLFDVNNWYEAAKQLDSINTSGLSPQTQEAVVALQTKANTIVAAIDSRDATVAAIQELQSNLPELERALALETANTDSARQIINAIAIPVVAEATGTVVNEAKTRNSKPATTSWFGKTAHKVMEFKKNNLGRIGVIGMAIEGVQIARKQKLSSAQHAVIRQQLTTLKEAKKFAAGDNSLEHLEDLGDAWSSMLALIKPEPEIQLEPTLSIAEQAYILDAAIKQLGNNSASQSQLAHQESIRKAIDNIDKYALLDILKTFAKPEIFPRNQSLAKLHGAPKHASSYLWLAEYLLNKNNFTKLSENEQKDFHRVMQSNTIIINNTMVKIAGSFGSANYLAAQKHLLNSKQKILKLRPTLQFNGKFDDTGKRQIEKRLFAESDYLDSKLIKIAEAGRNLQKANESKYIAGISPNMNKAAKKLENLVPIKANNSNPRR